MNPHLSLLLWRIPSNAFVVIRGNSELIRNGDVHFPFRQSSDFLYLTSIASPDIILTIYWSELILWRESISDKDILWWHSKLTDVQMMNFVWIHDIRDKNQFEEYYFNHKSSFFDESELRKIIDSLRIIKTHNEIEKIKKAIRVSHEAFAHIEKVIQPGMYEYEIEAEIARIFRCHHLTEAYPTIVASGSNSCILHYTQHSRQIQYGDLILIDAGCEYMGYASDTTRTLFVGDTMPDRIKQVYDSVLFIKKIAENTIKPGISFPEYENLVRSAMNIELQKLWLIPENSTEEEIVALSKKYYPHRTSHFLGLDVHDVGSRDAIFAPGMIITIEPGVYISEEDIWIRLEDDYLITDSGCEKLQ